MSVGLPTPKTKRTAPPPDFFLHTGNPGIFGEYKYQAARETLRNGTHTETAEVMNTKFFSTTVELDAPTPGAFAGMDEVELTVEIGVTVETNPPASSYEFEEITFTREQGPYGKGDRIPDWMFEALEEDLEDVAASMY